MTKRRGNTAHFNQRQLADIERDRAYELIVLHPGITMQGIADGLGRSKTSTYQYVAALVGTKVFAVETRCPTGKRGNMLAYHAIDGCPFEPEIKPVKFDMPSQVTVAAVDHAELPDPDPILSALFGRNKETA